MHKVATQSVRFAQRTLMAFALATAALAPMSPAHADSITQSEAVVSELSARLAHLSQVGETTANTYDAATARLATINEQIRHLDVQITRAQGALIMAAGRLTSAIVHAYVSGPTFPNSSPFNADPVQRADQQLYARLAITRLNHLRTAYDDQRAALVSSLGRVRLEQSQARHQAIIIRALLVQDNQTAAATRATLAAVTRSLATELIAYEVRRGVRAAQHHDTQGEAQAIAAASSVGGQSAANTVTLAIQSATPPPQLTQVTPSTRGLAAVRFAESQIGVPYVWGGETPGVGFDCSGLVQWAWSRVGVSIPRTTETQWPALSHVSLTSLQPGDLLYYYNLDGDHLVDHLVMYVGSGPYGIDTIIAAAHAGTTVSYAPLFTAGLIGAARP